MLTSQPATAIWPFASDGVRYVTPVAVARSFAVDYVGMTNPLVGSFTRTDARSGQVSLQTQLSGPVTTVHVSRVISDASWWVTSANTANINVVTPGALQRIHSPMAMHGTSTAFEAVVNVVFRVDGTVHPIAKGVVMGGSMGVMGPMLGSLRFTAPHASAGAVTFLTVSARDGSVSEATVVRVRY